MLWTVRWHPVLFLFVNTPYSQWWWMPLPLRLLCGLSSSHAGGNLYDAHTLNTFHWQWYHLGIASNTSMQSFSTSSSVNWRVAIAWVVCSGIWLCQLLCLHLAKCWNPSWIPDHIFWTRGTLRWCSLDLDWLHRSPISQFMHLSRPTSYSSGWWFHPHFILLVVTFP